jgi:hypothetical protein
MMNKTRAVSVFVLLFVYFSCNISEAFVVNPATVRLGGKAVKEFFTGGDGKSAKAKRKAKRKKKAEKEKKRKKKAAAKKRKRTGKTEKKYYNDGETVVFNSRYYGKKKVVQRDIYKTGKSHRGKLNCSRMKNGEPPYADTKHKGKDQFVDLHHVKQEEEGVVMEMARGSEHKGEDYKNLHRYLDKGEGSKIDRNKWGKFRREYWRSVYKARCVK